MNPDTVVKIVRLRDAIKETMEDPAVPLSVRMVFHYLDQLTNEEIPRG